MNKLDEATWLPVGALVVLGACDAQECDRVGYALPTYRNVVVKAPGELMGVRLSNILDQVDTWCPVHGRGRYEHLAQDWVDYSIDRFISREVPTESVRQGAAPSFAHLANDQGINWVHQRFTVSIAKPR